MKKKLLFFVFTLLSSLTASAYDAEVDGIYYNLVNKIKQAEVTNGDKRYTGSVNIPATVTYNDVTYNVKLIGEEAFNNCVSLTSVTIPNSVTSIGDNAFYDCGKLTSVQITDLAAWCNINFEDNPLFYAQHLYLNGMEVKDLVIPNGVTEIASDAFSGCSGLTSVTIGNSVTSIGDYAFSDCSGLTSVTIGNSVTSIGESAFWGCSGLTSVIIPNSVTSIGECAFRECSGLTSIDIPNSVTSIGEYAFYHCSGLTSVTIPSSVTSIGSSVFYGCSGLTSVTIPNSVTSIKSYAFSGCSSLISINIPNRVTSISRYTFSGCSSLTSITIPNSVTLIGSNAFEGCSSLTSVTIPNNVTLIGDKTFYGCKSLTSVTIPNSVTSIGKWAFCDCSGLTSVTIGNSVTSIGKCAFQNCAELKDVYCYAEKVPSAESTAFDGSYIEYATLYVPEGSVAAYKAAEPWSGFGTIKTLSGEIPVTPKCAIPTITIIDGKLSVDCETEDVKYVYNIVPMSPMSGEGLDIALPTSFKVTIYATKDGYENSEVATKEINVSGTSGLRGDLNGDGAVGMPDAMFIVNKMLKGKFPDE